MYLSIVPLFCKIISLKAPRYSFKIEINFEGETNSEKDENPLISVNKADNSLSSPPSFSFEGSFTISVTTSFDTYVEKAWRKNPFCFSAFIKRNAPLTIKFAKRKNVDAKDGI